MCRKSCLRVGLIAWLGLLAVSLIIGFAVYLSMPYGITGEIIQLAGEQARQQIMHASIEPVNFSDVFTSQGEQLARSVDQERLIEDLAWLADDARQGRLAGSPNEDEVGAWLERRLAGMGLRPFAEAGMNDFSLPFRVGQAGQQGENIIGLLPGLDMDQPAKERQYLIVGAHYDHEGIASDGQVYNGADDDASGVAAVLEIARVLSASPTPPRHSVVFVLFSAEEDDRRGSSAFGKQLRSHGMVDRSQFLNLEVLGPLPGTATTLDVFDEASLSTNALVAAVQVAGHALDIPTNHLGRDPSSDATRLLAYGVPSASLSASWAGGANHPNMHTPQDDVSSIDPQALTDSTRAALISAWLLANTE